MPTKSGRPSARRPRFQRDTELRRHAGRREERRSVLVITNGSRTEVDYFEALRREPWVTADKVRVKFEKGDPASVVLRAAAIRDDSAYDEAWVVCDQDEFNVKPAVENAHACEVWLALSVPCFEIWLILHLSGGCPRFNNAAQAGVYLKKLLATWDKTRLNFDEFRAGVSEAAARAQRLGDPPDANPATAVWRLVESLRAARPSDASGDSA